MGYRMNKDPFLVWELYHHCFPMAVDKGHVLSIDNPAALVTVFRYDDLHSFVREDGFTIGHRGWC